MNITINQINALKENYPRPQSCPNNKVLSRVTFGYKSSISGKDDIFPVTYANFDESFQKKH